MSLLLKNRYQILQVLSEAGGFGQTFLAEDSDTPSRRKCVIKKLRPLADSEDFKFVQRRFQREAAILEMLGESSDQIPKLYAYFVENQEFYLVQELVDGLTLRQKLQREGTLSEGAVRELLLSLLNVLEYVHSQNIIHRDIKPDNVILRQRDNKPVLIDFGIVKEVLRVGIDGSPTSSVMAGTPGYTASEQAAGRPIYASDIYSLGATAIYLLTGKNPQQMTDLATGDIAWQKFAPQVSPNFAAVLNKSTESHPRDRYKTVLEMREDLQKIIRGEQIVSIRPLPITNEEETLVKSFVPKSFVEQPPKPKYSLYFGGAILSLLVIIGALTFLFSSNDQSREAAQATNTQNNIKSNANNSTAIQNTNLLNANAANINSNIQSNSNIDVANANVSPTFDKIQVQKSMNQYISASLKKEDLEDEVRKRKYVYGDLDNDGDEDAAIQVDWVFSTGGNGYGTILFAFLNDNGTFKFFDGEAVGGKLYSAYLKGEEKLGRNFNLTGINGGRIYGSTEICSDSSVQIGLCGQGLGQIIKGRTSYIAALKTGKLVER